jgi:hypothetical protein
MAAGSVTRPRPRFQAALTDRCHLVEIVEKRRLPDRPRSGKPAGNQGAGQEPSPLFTVVVPVAVRVTPPEVMLTLTVSVPELLIPWRVEELPVGIQGAASGRGTDHSRAETG